jgi:hypothetical protein
MITACDSFLKFVGSDRGVISPLLLHPILHEKRISLGTKNKKNQSIVLFEIFQSARLYVAPQHCFVASDLSAPNPIKIRVFQRCFLINWWILTFHEIFLKIRPRIHPKNSKFMKKPKRKTSIKSSKIQNGALAHDCAFLA